MGLVEFLFNLFSGGGKAVTILIIGLGNPGPQYALNRHNVGFMQLDILAEDYDFSPEVRKGKALVREGRIGSDKVLLVKPMAYMNLSGNAVSHLVSFYKIPLDQIYVIHDDLDLAPFKVRVKKGGGAGGHNGLKNLDSTIGKDYWRIRLGVGHPGDRNKVSGYVLSNFPKDQQDDLVDMLGAVSDQMSLLLSGDKDLFLTKVAEACSKN